MSNTERRVRPNGLLVGSDHPPIFYRILNERTAPWTYRHATGGAMMQLASKLGFEERRNRAEARALFGMEVRSIPHEVYGNLYFADEGSDAL